MTTIGSTTAREHSKVTTLTDRTFPFTVRRQQRPILVEFFADWCPTCRRVAPILDELADDLDGRLTIARIDVERNPATTARHSVQALPTLIIFEHGTERTRITGASHRATIEDRLRQALPDVYAESPSGGRDHDPTDGEERT